MAPSTCTHHNPTPPHTTLALQATASSSLSMAIPPCHPHTIHPHTTHAPAGDRQFLFLNGRPVDLPKATKALNETYRSLSSPATASCKPMAVVDFRRVCCK